VEEVNLKSIISNITYRIGLKRTTIEKLNLYDFIPSTSNEKKQVIVSLISDYLKIVLGIETLENNYVYISPNSIDISIAIENILEEAGEAMSLDEILHTFNSLNPAHVIDNPLKLKPYIFRNQNIKSKGKTGIYVLKSWKNHFTGTLTSYLEHILRSFDEPITLDDLVDFAIEEFPNTNKKSITSLITMDKEARFIVYEGEYISLSDAPVLDFDLKKRKIIKRHTFDTRFTDFKEFVITMKRLPIQTGLEEEQSLARWLTNVLKSKIDSTEEQLSSLKEFIDNNKTLPQNGIEYNFKQMCDQVKIIVNKSFVLPSFTKYPSEYQWLKKNLDKYKSYEDNRKSYFEDLLTYLKDYGFYL
ncbi:MAG: hypothetical protein K2H60_14495, partial [Muribaculaceae bacterium]|nr:hypothetical protein [Muribaculaceae bacterium]